MSCRYQHMSYDVPLFKVLTCSFCYVYMFKPETTQLHLEFTRAGPVLKAGPEGNFKYSYPPGSVFRADLDNSSMVTQICEPLSESECEKWTTCCQTATKCCIRQQNLPTASQNWSHCPRTWDGFGCFDDTSAGSTAYISCPSYVEHASDQETAYKVCWPNGTWYVHPQTGKQWSNYSTCLHGKVKDQMVLIYIGLGCNLISLSLLIPSCAIFLAFRQLRIQQRVRLHICFFSSFIASAIIAILWDFIVVSDKMNSPGDESVVQQNTGGCKFLYVLKRYTQSATYFWMFCEGFYLHRLIVRAFEIPKSLIIYYFIGIGGPWISTIVYAIIKASVSEYDQNCWINNINGFEWLIYTPNLLCLFANVFFLGNILYILLTQLQSHPNEPSGYRRAIKATFVLIPLFGIQWGPVIYRPANTMWYEVLRIVIQHTQGAFVSLIFCIFNGEVHGHLKNCFSRISGRPLYRPRRELSTTSGTVYTQVRTSTAVDFNRDSYVRDSFNRDSYVRDSFNRDSLHKDDSVSNGKAETVPLNSNESSFSGDKQENGFLMESELK